MKLTVTIPQLPSSGYEGLDARHDRRRDEEDTWRKYITAEWAAMGKPQFAAIRITMRFFLPEEVAGDSAGCLSTGSKLVSKAVKGLLLSDIDPEYLTAWHFCFARGAAAQTTLVIEEERRKSDSWQRPACNHYDQCNAPLCPLDRDSLAGVWYPGEEVCGTKSYGNLPWVKAQRKIAKSAGRESGYFTLAMLNRNCIIRPGITGLDPDRENGPQVKKWLTEHAEKRELSAEEILMRKQLAQKCLNVEGDRNASEEVSAPFLKPPLNRVPDQKKCL